MSAIPRPVAFFVQELKRLPGMGGRAAYRVANHLLARPPEERKKLAQAVLSLAHVKACPRCHFWGEGDLCGICGDPKRDAQQICVVETPLDVLTIERSARYSGTYHVLGGVLSPLEGVEAKDLHADTLVERVKNQKRGEVIFALPATVEGEMTVQYIVERVRPSPVKLSKLANGVPFGSALEHTDEMTVSRAFEGRRDV